MNKFLGYSNAKYNSINEKVLLFKMSLLTLVFDVPHVKTLLNAENMVKPAIYNIHQWLFVDIAEKDRVDNFDHFLVQNSIHQLQTVLIHHFQNTIMTCIILNCY